MATIARLKKDGTLSLKGTLNERLPPVTSGLVAHYPLDGAAGAVDVIQGRGTTQNLESSVNLLDCLSTDWRNPTNWVSSAGGSLGANCVWDINEQAIRFDSLSEANSIFYLAIDPSKSYYMEYTAKQSGSGVW